MYFAKDGNKSYIFTKEFNYADILSADTVSFDFGLLSGDTNGDVNEDLFRLKFLYMSKINSDFVKVQYSKGRRTFKILEESQIVSDDVIAKGLASYKNAPMRQQIHQLGSYTIIDDRILINYWK